ncbi:MAG TPA: hypothetical protein VJH03_24385 [Blastocatellia bacterium]|nr:hypothetical protein [Blastocatellia bacterium]
MELRHPDIRRYAIDNRVEMRIVDSKSGRECAFNTRGQMRIPSENKDLRLEDLLADADRFEILAGGKARVLTRDQFADVINEAFRKRGFAVHKDDDD